MDKELLKKLKISSANSVLIAGAPNDFSVQLANADVKINRGKKYDFVLLFVTNKSDVKKKTPPIFRCLSDDHRLWIAYPKKNSKIKTDVNRDYGWDAVGAEGYEAVSQIAIDDTWSALRFVKKEKKETKNQLHDNRISFTATIETPDDGMGAFISIPFNVEKTFGTKGHIKVKAWFDDYPYRGILANMGTGCHVIIVRKDIQKTIGKKSGDKIHVVLEHDLEERAVEVPDDLQQALSKARRAKEFYDSLSFTNRKEYAVWIASAKKQETRQKRLSETIRKLQEGKRNPSEK